MGGGKMSGKEWAGAAVTSMLSIKSRGRTNLHSLGTTVYYSVLRTGRGVLFRTHCSWPAYISVSGPVSPSISGHTGRSQIYGIEGRNVLATNKPSSAPSKSSSLIPNPSSSGSAYLCGIVRHCPRGSASFRGVQLHIRNLSRDPLSNAKVDTQEPNHGRARSDRRNTSPR